MNMVDLYTDYLLSSFSQTSATGLSSLVDHEISHDQITYFLSSRNFTSIDLWHIVKKKIRKIEGSTGVLIFDDTIEKKPHSKENDIICWHYDHTTGRSEKGINIVNCLYNNNEVSLPVSFELVHKYAFCTLDKHEEKRKSDRTKNEMMRDMLEVAQNNNLEYSYVLADSWYASSENMTFIVNTIGKYFVMPLKSNRKIATSKQKLYKEEFVHLQDLPWQGKPLKVWVKGVVFPLLIHKQVFTNKDDSIGILYLVSNNLECTKQEIEEIYQKRWNIETFYRTLKQNASLEKSPTKVVRTQSNHIFMAIVATVKLEYLSIQEKCNHYKIKWRLYQNALKSAFIELRNMKNGNQEIVIP